MLNHIYCLGAANIDWKLKSQSTPRPYTSNPVSVSTSFGGVACNVAANLAQWTSHIHLQTAVGDDEQAKRLLAHMHSAGVHIEDSLIIPDAATAQYIAILNPDGELEIAYANMGIYDHIPLSLFTDKWNWPKHSLIFLDTNLPVALIRHAMDYCYQHDLRLCIDPVSVEKAHKLPLHLDSVFLLKPNQFEASALTQIPITSISDAIKAGVRLHKQGVHHVIITLGKEGFVLVNTDVQQHYQTVPLDNVKDANGAGDAFCAGILFGLQQNMTIMEACNLGAAAATRTLTSLDTVASNLSTLSLCEAI